MCAEAVFLGQALEKTRTTQSAKRSPYRFCAWVGNGRPSWRYSSAKVSSVHLRARRRCRLDLLAENRQLTHCGCSSAGALDLLAGFAPLEPNEGFLVAITNMPTAMAITMKVSAATTILLKCRRAGRSPEFGSELIMKFRCCLLAPKTRKGEILFYFANVQVDLFPCPEGQPSWNGGRDWQRLKQAISFLKAFQYGR
jgi:hypothetical protein